MIDTGIAIILLLGISISVVSAATNLSEDRPAAWKRAVGDLLAGFGFTGIAVGLLLLARAFFS